jgi:hypothetical protein
MELFPYLTSHFVRCWCECGIVINYMMKYHVSLLYFLFAL